MLGTADRTYEDGRQEWRRHIGNGLTEWHDNQGSSGYDKDLGNGWFRRGDDYGRDYGSYIWWSSSGSFERKWDCQLAPV